MVDLSRRADLTEKMDADCTYRELRDCLRDIARVNRLTWAYRPTMRWLKRVMRLRTTTGPLRIVDVGCGYGDMLRTIESWARRNDYQVELIGVDLNANAIRSARETTDSHSEIVWLVGDVYSCAGAVNADIVISSLLTHHLCEAEVVRFLAWMEKTARVGWFVNDLHRHPLPFYLFRAAVTFSPLHPFVRNDGPVSIRRSFVPGDWLRMCRAAGLAEGVAAITAIRPARLCVERLRGTTSSDVDAMRGLQGWRPQAPGNRHTESVAEGAVQAASNCAISLSSEPAHPLP